MFTFWSRTFQRSRKILWNLWSTFDAQPARHHPWTSTTHWKIPSGHEGASDWSWQPDGRARSTLLSGCGKGWLCHSSWTAGSAGVGTRCMICQMPFKVEINIIIYHHADLWRAADQSALDLCQHMLLDWTSLGMHKQKCAICNPERNGSFPPFWWSNFHGNSRIHGATAAFSRPYFGDISAYIGLVGTICSPASSSQELEQITMDTSSVKEEWWLSCSPAAPLHGLWWENLEETMDFTMIFPKETMDFTMIFYRKPWILPWVFPLKMGFSCKFSPNPLKQANLHYREQTNPHGD